MSARSLTGLLLAPAMLLALAQCTRTPAGQPEAAAVVPVATHPAEPVVRVVDIRTIAPDFPAFCRDRIGTERRFSMLELMLELHTPWPMAPVGRSPLTIASFTDDQGTDLSARSKDAWSASFWPSTESYGSTPLNADGHRVLVQFASVTPPAPGATRVFLRGHLTVPVGVNPTVSNFRETSLEVGTKVSFGKMALELKTLYSEEPRKAYSADRMLPRLYSYNWEVTGAIEQIQSVEFIGADGKPLVSEMTKREGSGSPDEVRLVVTSPLEVVHVRVTWFESIEKRRIPIDLSTTIAAATGATDSAAPAAARTPQKSGPVRVIAVGSARPVPRAQWAPFPITGISSAEPFDRETAPGVRLSFALLSDSARIANFEPRNVTIRSITDDRGTDLLAGHAVLHGLQLQHYNSPRPLLLTKDRDACFFGLQIPGRLPSEAQRLTVRGSVRLEVDEAPVAVTFGPADFAAGGVLKVGPHRVKVTLDESRERTYEFDCADNALIESITFVDGKGAPMRDQHYRHYKKETLVYRLLTPATPASLEVRYFSNPKPREIPFELTVGLGL